MSLRLENAHLRLGGAAILNGLDLEVRPGQLTCLLGPNGAGKSTAFSLLTGERRPHRGRVLLDGAALESWDPQALARRRAVVLQSGSVAFPLRVHELVALGRAPHGVGRAPHGVGRAPHGAARAADAAAVAAAMAAADVSHLAMRVYPTLSGGEQQRVQFARALAQIAGDGASAPRYLLLDEPTASLDLKHQWQLLEAAARLARGGAGVLCVLHDLNLAAAFADHVLVIAAGRNVAEGPARDVLTRTLLAEVYEVAAEVQTGAGGRPVITLGGAAPRAGASSS